MEWIILDEKMPPRQTPVLAVCEIPFGRKRHVMVAWRKSEWEIFKHKQAHADGKDVNGKKWVWQTYEWEGITNAPSGGRIKDIRKVIAWQKLPRLELLPFSLQNPNAKVKR